ncbi:hypothetical protein LTR66_006586 [Elasticomyces elasticus]|nr:hypothetical protein LTR66_006586 [Elasticomyces elasticus]
MFGFGDNDDNPRDAYSRCYDGDEPRNEGSLGHEVIAGGASFAAMKIFEDRQRKEGTLASHSATFSLFMSQATDEVTPGKPVSHAFAKELLAGIAGAEVDKLAETKGMDEYEKHQAKEHAKRSAENMYDQHYGQYDEYNPNEQEPPRHIREHWGDNEFSGRNDY